MKKTIVLITMMLTSAMCSGYEFKGYEMGITLSDFKSRGVHRDAFILGGSPGVLICSDDSSNRESDFVIQLDRYPENTVVMCTFRQYMWLTISGGTYPIKPTFTFVTLPNHSEPVLSMIDFELFSTNFTSLLVTLKEKYKNPVSSSSRNLQNNFGAGFRNEKYIWRDKTSEIELEKYTGGYNSEKSSVYFFLKSGEKEMGRLMKEKSKVKKSGF